MLRLVVAAGLAGGVTLLAFWRRRVESGAVVDQHSSCAVDQYIHVPDMAVDEPLVHVRACVDWQCDRGEAARLLCLAPGLSQYSRQRVRQRLTWRQAAWLAAWQNSDVSLLPSLPPASLAHCTDRHAQLRQLLDVVDVSSPLLDDAQCVQFWRQMALHALPPAWWRCSGQSRYCVDDATLTLRRHNVSAADMQRSCLQAVLACPRAMFCRERLVSPLLDTLTHTVRQFGDKKVFVSLTAKLIDRLVLSACHHRQHEGGDAGRLGSQLHRGGWLRQLAEWSGGRWRDCCLSVWLPARRALHNLAWLASEQRAFCRPLPHNVHVLHPAVSACWQRTRHVDVDVVFVHGLLGGVERTWRQRDPVSWQAASDNDQYSHCWPRDWLPDDLAPLNVRVLGVDFDSSWSERMPRCEQGATAGQTGDQHTDWLHRQAEDVRQSLLQLGVGSRPIVWVTHSMGGLIVKQLLVNESSSVATSSCTGHDRNEDASSQPAPGSLLNSTQGVVFLSCPHTGSSVVSRLLQSTTLARLVLPSVELRQLEADSERLQVLRAQFVRLCGCVHVHCLSVAETQPARLMPRVSAVLVEPQSADAGCGQLLEAADTDHLTVCKPQNRHCPVYRRLVDFITNCVSITTPHCSTASQTVSMTTNGLSK